MKVISVRQPWAWWIFHGKDIENREQAWPWNGYHGPVLIHASAACTRMEYFAAVLWIKEHIGVEAALKTPLYDKNPQYNDELVRGAILGSVFLDRVVQQSRSRWFTGPHGLVLRDPVELVTPIPARGALGLWNWEPTEPLTFKPVEPRP